jgi:putative nucleotidyltransferase with HDIG domain
VRALAVEIVREIGSSPDLPAALEKLALTAEELGAADEHIRVAVDLAAAVDRALQGIGDQERSLPALLAECWGETATGTVPFEALSALDRLYERYSPFVLKTPPRLTVCPAVMFKALAMLSNEEVGISDIEKVAGCDPVITTSLLRVANSALYGRSGRVTSTRAAISQIGLNSTRRVILAASARPLFESSELRGLWQHSVDVAGIAEQIASSTGAADASDAFVAGLVHDIGRLAIEMVSDDGYVMAHRHLTAASGCPILADFVLNGHDHGQIGASIMSIWRMPEELIDTIRHHHRPELSQAVMPSIVYLAECASHSNEDIPVESRLQGALQTVKLESLESISSDERRLATALASLG